MSVTYQRGQLSRPMARKLAMARASRRWTLKQAAAEIGCSITTAWALENGTRVPSVATAAAVARAYQLDREETIGIMSEAVAWSGRKRADAKAPAS